MFLDARSSIVGAASSECNHCRWGCTHLLRDWMKTQLRSRLQEPKTIAFLARNLGLSSRLVFRASKRVCKLTRLQNSFDTDDEKNDGQERRSRDTARLTRRSRITATFLSLDGVARRRTRGWSTRGRGGSKTWWRDWKKRDDDNANVSHYDKVQANDSSNRTSRTFTGAQQHRTAAYWRALHRRCGRGPTATTPITPNNGTALVVDGGDRYNGWLWI